MKILLVGNIYNIHICRLISHMNRLNPNLEIDIFNTVEGNNKLPLEATLFSNIFHRKKHFYVWMYKIPLLGFLLFRIFDTCLSFSSATKGKNYNLINIHFITLESFFLMPLYKRKATTIMSSPWGSDMYRKKGINKWITKKVLDWSTYVSAPKIQFREDIKSMYKVPENKFIELGFGADAIDLIIQNSAITKADAKNFHNIADKYVITCGYNGTNSQNHLKIISSLVKILEKLPNNLFLLFPMTYGADLSYIKEVEETLKVNGFQYKIFDKFLTDMELVNLRKATDIFIHAQPSDAFSASIQEYLLCDTLIVNGKWTRYPDFEKFGIPYYIFNSFEELPECIYKAFQENPKIVVSDGLKEFIKKKGWRYLSEKWNEFYFSDSV